jgi:hypothetical protein
MPSGTTPDPPDAWEIKCNRRIRRLQGRWGTLVPATGLGGPPGARAVRKRRGGDPHQASMERSIQAVFSWICMR